ncbi:unnamed protein product, partial [Musa hybrid cultivar]
LVFLSLSLSLSSFVTAHCDCHLCRVPLGGSEEMKNSVSDRNLFIESEEDDDVDEEEERKAQPSRAADDDDSDGSDSSSSPDDDDDDSPPRSRPNSYSTNWPQSYRQSIDMYSSVTPPTIGFLGTPTLSRLSSSFLSSSFRGKHTPEIIASLIKPLLPTTAADLQLQDEERQSSHSLLIPPLPSRKPSLEKIQEKVSHELPVSRSCSYGQAVLNGMNVLCGVGILSTPYAVKEGGWLGLSILLTFAVLAWYTGILLRSCLDSEEGLETYPDIGQAAFGTTGRFAISIILYMELYACCVEYIILERDNLSSLFPNAQLNIGGIHLDSRLLFAILTTILVLPTTWLRDLSVLSYISVGGVIASVMVVLSLFWVGTVDKVGFQNKGTSLNLSGIPIAIGIYGYCYSGHAVFPNIYSSLKKPNQYPSVLFTSFAICTVMFAGVAVMGYTMFGESTQSQFTLNMPHNLVASRVAVWTTSAHKFLWKFLLSLTYENICINSDSFGTEFGGVDTIKPIKVALVCNHDKNNAGSFYSVSGSFRPFLWFGDGFYWIFAHNARYFDSSMCLFLEHTSLHPTMSLEPFARSLLHPPSRIRVSFLSSFPFSFPPSPLVPFGSLLLGFAASVAPADAGDGSRLVRLAGRAFYDDVSLKGDNQPKNGRGDNRGMAVIVLDALTRRQWVREEDLAKTLKLHAKQLRRILRFFEEEKLVMRDHRKESAKGAKIFSTAVAATGDGQQVVKDGEEKMKMHTHSYCCLDYAQIYDVIRYRMHRMKKKIKDELDSRNTIQEYICPNCGRRYSAFDALQLVSFTDEYFHCENCNGELVAESDKLAAEEMGDGDDNARRRRREKLKDMLQKMEEQLKPLALQLARVKDLPVPEFGSLQAWEARANAAARANGDLNALDPAKSSQGQGYSGTPMPFLGETRVEVALSGMEVKGEDNESDTKTSALKVIPPWMIKEGMSLTKEQRGDAVKVDDVSTYGDDKKSKDVKEDEKSIQASKKKKTRDEYLKAYYAALLKRQKEQEEASRMQREAERSQSDLVDGVLEAYSERQVGKKAKREDYENDDVEWEEVPSAGLVVFSTTFCYYTYMCP